MRCANEALSTGDSIPTNRCVENSHVNLPIELILLSLNSANEIFSSHRCLASASQCVGTPWLSKKTDDGLILKETGLMG
jgi:hypothetical protein